jgi:tripartite-type tricarboxylate transporter receptor subunit TctC
MRIGLLITLLVFSWSAQAAYPEKPIRFVLPSAAGGSVDVLMRILAQQLSAQMGVPFVVENKPGASFVLGTMDIVRALPDGYTLGYGNLVSLAINKSLLGSIPYDVEKDLTLVSNCVRVFNLLRSPVFPDLPTIAEAGVPGYETTSSSIPSPTAARRRSSWRWSGARRRSGRK